MVDNDLTMEKKKYLKYNNFYLNTYLFKVFPNKKN